MRMRVGAALLLAVGTLAYGQDASPAGTDFETAVKTGQEETARDERARKLQALIAELEAAGAFEDGQFEALETLWGLQESSEEAPPALSGPPGPTRYGDE
jgi:uncharacterized protein HemY